MSNPLGESPLDPHIEAAVPFGSWQELSDACYDEDGKRRQLDFETWIRVLRTSRDQDQLFIEALRKVSDIDLHALNLEIHRTASDSMRVMLNYNPIPSITSEYSATGFPRSGPASFAYFNIKKTNPHPVHSREWCERWQKDLECLQSMATC